MSKRSPIGENAVLFLFLALLSSVFGGLPAWSAGVDEIMGQWKARALNPPARVASSQQL